jgi:hypothetical protein
VKDERRIASARARTSDDDDDDDAVTRRAMRGFVDGRRRVDDGRTTGATSDGRDGRR